MESLLWNTWYYTLSTIAQVFASILWLYSVFVIFKIEKINDLEKTMQSAGWNLKDAPVVLAEMLSLAPQKVKKMIVAATDSLPSIGMSQASAESDDEAQK